MRDFDFKIRKDGTKYVIWLEDLDYIVLTEKQVKEFQAKFDSMVKEETNR